MIIMNMVLLLAGLWIIRDSIIRGIAEILVETDAETDEGQ